MNTMTTRDIYVRHTDTAGKAYVSEHRVWDAERFLAARKKDAADLNEKQKSGDPRKASTEQITQEQYLKERTK